MKVNVKTSNVEKNNKMLLPQSLVKGSVQFKGKALQDELFLMTSQDGKLHLIDSEEENDYLFQNQSKMVKLMGKILISKQIFVMRFAFTKIRTVIKDKKNKQIAFLKLFFLLKNILSQQIENKKIIGLKYLAEQMFDKRIKQINMSILASKIFGTMLNQIRKIFIFLKTTDKRIVKNKKINNDNCRKISIEIMKRILANRLFCFFIEIKSYKNVKDQNINLIVKNNSSSFSRSKANTLSLYMNNMSKSTKKMTKNKIKSAEYRIEPKNLNKQYFQFWKKINCLLEKRMSFFFNQLKAQQVLVDNIQKNDEKIQDSDQIFTNVLKHICWISARQLDKEKLYQSKNNEQTKINLLKNIISKRQRKQKIIMKQSFYNWNKQILINKLNIVQKVIELTDLKQKYIQSYK